ncbi:hypothetical protein baBA2_000930 (plasmid) [Borrelia anserina]|uniref:Lipoprotein n=1 Tax=Borrelia anserina Es TaxID=1365188 RepID=A0ABM6FVH0_BORAN|nr:hypothetical protein [Borrelia anserina]APR65336.1 hypothetical protein N187_A17 [Borrelia anserina Es]UPA07304.1 hypothetical protein baBA2_000930 [Borrelia anserina]
MKFSMVVYYAMSLVLGCAANHGEIKLYSDGSRDLLLSESELEPFVKSMKNEVCDDFKLLVDHFKSVESKRLSSQLNNVVELCGISLLASDSVYLIAPKLENYGGIVKRLENSNALKKYNVYMSLGYDHEIINLLMLVLVDLGFNSRFSGSDEKARNSKIVSMLLFNLERLMSSVSLLEKTLSDENIIIIMKDSNVVMADHIVLITSYLLEFMQAKDDLVRDFKEVIRRAAIVRGDRQAMEAELKKIINDGKIRKKIGAIDYLVKDIRDLVGQLVGAVEEDIKI